MVWNQCGKMLLIPGKKKLHAVRIQEQDGSMIEPMPYCGSRSRTPGSGNKIGPWKNMLTCSIRIQDGRMIMPVPICGSRSSLPGSGN